MRPALLRRLTTLAAALATVVAVATPLRAATIAIVDQDGAGVGLNDPTPVAPAGGNPATTLGAQRRNALQRAADLWGALLESTVEIRVDASFTTLPCSSTSAVIGETGPNSVHRDFAGAPVANTWYAAALANSLAGADLNPALDDATSTYNAAIGTTCSFPTTFYYGFDAAPPPGRIDFVSVALHELAHGLGFLTFVASTGARLSGRDDAFMRWLEDHRTAKLFPAMTDAERASASTASGSLHWVGPLVVALSGELTAGVGPNGHVHMYAPSPYESGSSVSHVDTAAAPNELMEPSYVGPNHDLALTSEFLEDVGWTLASPAPAAPTPLPTPVCGAVPAPGCRTSIAAGKGLLAVVDKPSDEKDSFTWTWLRGASTAKADFGDPLRADTYELCVYDATPRLVMHATAPAGGFCATSATRQKPCWSENGSGFRYLDKTRTPLGIQSILLKSGLTPGSARIVVRGKGATLELPPLPLAQPVVVQLRNSSGACWAATYDAPARKNTAGPPGRFTDKAD